MPTPAPVADVLLERARSLRRLARTIESLDAMLLYRRAGIDTWIGPTPQRCFDELLAARSTLTRAADELGRNAAQLERRAAQSRTTVSLAGLSSSMP